MDDSLSGTPVTRFEALPDLRRIADNLPVLVLHCDAAARYRFANRLYATRFGRTPQELVGQAMSDVMGPSAYEVVRPYVARALAGEEVAFEADVPFERIGPRTMRCRFIPGVSASGTVEGFTGITLDVTEQRRAESALRDREAHFRLAFELSAVGQAMIDAERRYRLVNDRFCAITGYPREELLGRRPEDITHPDDIARDVALASALLCGEVQGITSEKRYIRKDGTVCWVRVHATRFEGGSGAPTGAFSMIEDVTDRVVAAEQRETLYGRERVARLEAEAANRTKDEFLAALSHELRTPLNAILGWTQILRRNVLDPTQACAALDAVMRSARKQARLVDDLLDVSRIAAGRIELRPQRVTLRAVIEAAIEIVRPSMEGRRLRLTERLEPVIDVEADPIRLQQVFWNLLSNAVKFTPDGGCIDIASAVAADGIRVTVRDSGIGIDPGFLPRLFAPFEQADRSTTRTAPGLGLGLTIARRLLELHGGTITAESAGPGQGATFTVILPLSCLRSGRPDDAGA